MFEAHVKHGCNSYVDNTLLKTRLDHSVLMLVKLTLYHPSREGLYWHHLTNYIIIIVSVIGHRGDRTCCIHG